MFAENIILDMTNSYKFNFIIFRFFNVIGLTSNKFYKKNKKNTNLLPLVIEVALKMKDNYLFMVLIMKQEMVQQSEIILI